MNDNPHARALAASAKVIRSSFNRRPSLGHLAAVAGLSRFHFRTLFKAHFGESPRQMTVRLQTDFAKRLLRRGVPTAEVATRCGFSDQAHFTRAFKGATGMSPVGWLRQARETH
jgi:AraC family transcriptional regulator